jgi:hypothetical protein
VSTRLTDLARQRFLGDGVTTISWDSDSIKIVPLNLDGSLTTAGIKAVTGGITNATPMVVTSLAHGFSNGDILVGRGVVGTTAANNTFSAQNVTANTFELWTVPTSTEAAQQSTGNGGYISGGTFVDLTLVSFLSDVDGARNAGATDIEFIESLVIATSGTDLANDGTINLMTGLGGAGSVMAAIVALDNATFYAHHYVPAGVTCYVNKHTGAGTLAAGRTYMVRTGNPTAVGPVLQIGDIIIHLAGSTEDHDYETPLVVPGPDLIVMRENPIASAAGNLAYASFDWVQF